MEEKEGSREEELKRLIISEINLKGPITFSQFMELCLYHPIYGYYQSNRIKVGKNGDFFTSPCVHPLFGGLVAKQLSQMAEFLEGETFDILEIGCGNGFLASDILDWCKQKRAQFYKTIKYYLLEANPKFLNDQKERLLEHEKEGKLFYLDQEDFKNARLRIQGCIISNELIDSFPVHRVILHNGILKEAYVNQKNGKLIEQWGKISDIRIYEYLNSMGINLQEAQMVEVNLKAIQWIEEVSRCLKKGFVITIDYGYLSQELFDVSRASGTLLCYYRHNISDNFFKKLGKQDITSHVNFTALIKKGEEVGLSFTGLVPQFQFLISLGLLQELESLEKGLDPIEALKLRLTLKHLIEPDIGMGEVFKVLIQHKGIEKPNLDGLKGFSSISPGDKISRME
jgi:SAM-dependent MidA family methyltransferase